MSPNPLGRLAMAKETKRDKMRMRMYIFKDDYN
jgi:hypothetical protein